MNPQDLKKLISGFLLLATITGTGAFIFSNFRLTFSSQHDVPRKTGVPALAGNAFVEPLPEPPTLPPDLITQNEDANL
ncbi:MAG: hypothetical protein AAB967_03000, partial [Patescibacteria group bacterium]